VSKGSAIQPHRVTTLPPNPPRLTRPCSLPARAGVNKLLDLGLTVSPVKNFDGATADELLQWLFWRGTGDMKFHTTMVLYEPPGVADAALGDARQLRTAFEGAADDLLRFSNLRFGSVSSGAIVEELELPVDRSTLVVYFDHDEGRAVYSGPPEAALIREWVLRHDVPLVTTIWHRNLQQTRKRVATVGLFFVTARQAEDPPTLARIKAGLQEVVLPLVQSGRIVRGDFTLGVVDGGKYRSWLAEYGLPEVRAGAGRGRVERELGGGICIPCTDGQRG
jgi:hypothetical protein